MLGKFENLEVILLGISQALYSCRKDYDVLPDEIVINFKEGVIRDQMHKETLEAKGYKFNGKNWEK